MKKFGFLITARLKSSRLPLKLLKEINDIPVIEHVIQRIKQIDDFGTIVLCTSTNPNDKPLVDVSVSNDIYYFNGDEEDVLSRLLTAAKLYNLDYIVGITGENPLFSLEYTREIIQKINSNEDYDFIYPKGLPIGCATYAIKTKALETVCAVKNVVDTEIWGYLINRPELFHIDLFDVAPDYHWPDLRITIDYPEDFEFVSTIFQQLSAEERLDLKQVLSFLKEHPEIVAIHHNRKQLDLDEATKTRIEDYFRANKNEILQMKTKIYAQ